MNSPTQVQSTSLQGFEPTSRCPMQYEIGSSVNYVDCYPQCNLMQHVLLWVFVHNDEPCSQSSQALNNTHSHCHKCILTFNLETSIPCIEYHLLLTGEHICIIWWHLWEHQGKHQVKLHRETDIHLSRHCVSNPSIFDVQLGAHNFGFGSLCHVPNAAKSPIHARS